MTDFHAQLKSIILQSGPIPVEQFMAMAIAHYYSTRDPFGQGGDFITAPEISQMFGEMIGVFMADAWMQSGAPARFILAEIGPGRGTLMADILRATRHVPGFHDAASVHLVEISPVLRQHQREALGGRMVTWHDTVESLPRDMPIFMVGNEFLDALPVRQYVWHGGAWMMRVVGLSDQDQLIFGAVPTLAQHIPPGAEGDIYEVSPAREIFVEDMARRVAEQGGVVLLIDYGHDISASGDTFQAVKEHHYVDVLEHVGEADLTSHVDFGRLKQVAAQYCAVHGPVGQGDFLRSLGIEMRAQKLGQESELKRLCDDDAMGQLFRVMVLSGKVRNS